MTSWLISQAVLDQRYSKPDNFEEQLKYGLFQRSHTEQSLASELSNTFEILECSYAMYDPRYVMGVVERKKEINVNPQLETHKILGEPETPCLDLCKMSLKDVLKDISIICDLLEEHEGRVSQFFDRAKPGRPGSKNNPLHAVQADLPRFIELLEDVFIVLSDPCA